MLKYRSWLASLLLDLMFHYRARQLDGDWGKIGGYKLSRFKTVSVPNAGGFLLPVRTKAGLELCKKK
jgi:hypothetical protein